MENFVLGPSNLTAYQACLNAAESPIESPQRLYIHGGAGFGKTHLLHALAHLIRKNRPACLLYLASAERFTKDLARARRQNQLGEFRNQMLSFDMILLDCMDDLQRNERAQKEFAWILNRPGLSAPALVVVGMPRFERLDLNHSLRSILQRTSRIQILPPETEISMAIVRMLAGSWYPELPDEVARYLVRINNKKDKKLEPFDRRVL